MDFSEGKKEFIETWGMLAVRWGECKTVGLVHALLLISHQPKCTDEIMESLHLSRGNVTGTLHRLLDIGIIFKENIEGERKTYYIAEKDMWKVMRAVAQERKKKELDPMISVLEKLNEVHPQCKESEVFCHTIREIKDFSIKADRMLDAFTGTEVNWFLKSMNRVMMR